MLLRSSIEPGVTKFFGHGHVTVTGRDRDRESRPFFLVCPNSLTLFLKRCTLWRMLNILILFVKSTTVCCCRKKENLTQLIFNKNISVILSQQNNTDHFVTTRDQLPVTVTSRSRTFKRNWLRPRPWPWQWLPWFTAVTPGSRRESTYCLCFSWWFWNMHIKLIWLS